MNELAGPESPPWLEPLSLLILVATVVPWVWMVRRLLARKPILPYERRSPVPWGFVDLLPVWFWVAMLVWAAFEEHARLETEPRAAAEVGADRESESQHTLVRVLEADPSIPTLIVCMLTGVVVAPIVEEFLFRVLLQGWLEAVERRLRRRIGVLRRVVPGVLPVLIGAVVFALPHYRETDPAATTPQVGDLLLNAGASALLMLIGLCLVRIRAGATWKDVGFDRTKLWADVRVGLVAALAVLGPIYVIQFCVKLWLMPGRVAADPITLLFFAAVLGTLYLRTHRIAAAVTLHMALNLTSLLAAWIALASKGP